MTSMEEYLNKRLFCVQKDIQNIKVGIGEKDLRVDELIELVEERTFIMSEKKKINASEVNAKMNQIRINNANSVWTEKHPDQHTIFLNK